MAIAFVRGELARDAYYQPEDPSQDKMAFAACSVKETYVDRTGEERLGGYHDVIAFGDLARRLGVLEKGDEVSVKASIRYRADRRFVSTQDKEKNPFTAQFVVMDFLDGTGPERLELDDDEEEDVFGLD